MGMIPPIHPKRSPSLSINVFGFATLRCLEKKVKKLAQTQMLHVWNILQVNTPYMGNCGENGEQKSHGIPIRKKSPKKQIQDVWYARTQLTSFLEG